MPDGISLKGRLEHRIAKFLLSLPPGQQLRLCGGAPVQRDGLTLHPEMQLLLSLRARLGAPSLGEHPPVRGRELLRREALTHYGEPIDVGAVRELEVSGATGPLKARLYSPESSGGQARPLLVYLHGGGFALGDLETHDSECRLLCRHAGLHVLAVEYRLAPENPFPAALDDARAAFRWAFEHALELGADPRRVAIGGDSAGGNLAAVVSQLARNEGPVPALQLLIYPVADRSIDRPSIALFGSGYFLTRADIETFQAHYAGDTRDARVSPLLAKDLSNLPPALVITAGFDPLRDEGEAYAATLRAAGTPVVLRRFDGMIHGFANFVGVSRAARDAVGEIAGALRAMLETATNERTGRTAA